MAVTPIGKGGKGAVAALRAWRAKAAAAGGGVARTGAMSAQNAANGAKLRARLVGEEIAGGHAYKKHVIDGGEFPGVRAVNSSRR
jgi:hypothetical protein